MKKWWHRLKRTNIILSGIMMCVGIGILWIFYGAQNDLLDEVMREQSEVEMQLLKRTYELEQAEVRMREGEIDTYLERQTRFATNAINQMDVITDATLDGVREDYHITGLWVIDERNKVRYGTSGEMGMDAAGFYTEFVDKDFPMHLEAIREEIGTMWTGPFKLSHHDEGGYMKYVYTSIENPENRSETLVIEIGASIDEIKNKRYGTDRFIARHALPSSIRDVQIDVRPGTDQTEFTSVTTLDDPFTFRVTMPVEDLGNNSLIIAEMSYSELAKEQRAFFYTLVIATSLMAFIFLVALLTSERKDYAEIVKTIYQANHRQSTTERKM